MKLLVEAVKYVFNVAVLATSIVAVWLLLLYFVV
jgi:hypothetical protein